MKYIAEEKKKVFSSYFSSVENAKNGQLEALKENISQYAWLVNTARDEVTKHFLSFFGFSNFSETFKSFKVLISQNKNKLFLNLKSNFNYFAL